MIINLSTPFNPGDHDPGKTYNKAKVQNILIDMMARKIDFTVTFGSVVDGEWVPGTGTKRLTLTIRNQQGSPAFTTLMDQLTLDGETLGAAMKRLFIAALKAMNNVLDGTEA
jgi:hypothetical protein